MRKHEEDQNTTNHDNRSLTPRMKQFKNDEMGTTRKGRSHLCFRPLPNFINSLAGEKNKYWMKLNRAQLNFN